MDGKECRYWFRPNPSDYRKCSLSGKNDNCDEISDCFIKELLGKLARKEQECKELKKANDGILTTIRILAKNNIKLREVLTEIKESAEKVYNDCVDCYRDVDTNCDVDCIGCTLGGKAELAEQILQRISECEV